MRDSVAYRFTKLFSGPLRDEGGLYGQLYNRFGIGFVDVLSFVESVYGNKLEGIQFLELDTHLPARPITSCKRYIHVLL
jgi:hypothetical protein